MKCLIALFRKWPYQTSKHTHVYEQSLSCCLVYSEQHSRLNVLKLYYSKVWRVRSVVTFQSCLCISRIVDLILPYLWFHSWLRIPLVKRLHVKHVGHAFKACACPYVMYEVCMFVCEDAGIGTVTSSNQQWHVKTGAWEAEILPRHILAPILTHNSTHTPSSSSVRMGG